MTERIGSRLCESGFHFDCPGCKGCPCHPRSGRVPDRPDGQVPQTGCRGTTWTADRDDAA